MTRIALGQTLVSSAPGGLEPKAILDWYEGRLSDYNRIHKEKGGLPLSDHWRAQYLQNPYLLLCSEAELRERWIDVFANTCTLTQEGKIGMDVGELKKPGSMTEAFTHMLEAFASRGGVEGDCVNMGTAELSKYFADGEPPGVAMFKNMPQRLKNSIVKFSRREFLEPMLKEGKLRMAPASYYARGSHIKSVRDLETEKTIRIPAVREALAGQTHYNYEGKNLPIEGGAITLPIVVPDYFLFSSCLDLDRRMPTDFEADAALIVRDAELFTRKVKKAFKKKFGQANVYHGPVTYFDPFNWRPRGPMIPEMMKHFAFTYQKEHRIVVRPIGRVFEAEPVFLNIGSMEAYAEIVP